MTNIPCKLCENSTFYRIYNKFIFTLIQFWVILYILQSESVECAPIGWANFKISFQKKPQICWFVDFFMKEKIRNIRETIWIAYFYFKSDKITILLAQRCKGDNFSNFRKMMALQW